MRLKSFYAKTMMEAMQQVRDTLGENAIIVASREEGGSVRLTAAIDEDVPSSTALGFGARNNVDSAASTQAQAAYDDIAEADAAEAEEGVLVERITDILLRHGTPTDVMDTILSTATMVGLGDIPTTLFETFEHIFGFHPLPSGAHRKPLMLVGTPGSGKSLFITKLATRAVLNGLKPAVISTDTQRAGSLEQLASFTKILNVPLKTAKSAADLREVLKTVKDADCIFIDTSGVNPFEVDDMRNLAQLAEAGPIEPVLIQAAGGDADEMAEIASCFAVLGVQRQVFSRLDITKKLGGVLASALKGSLAFSDISTSAMPSNGIAALTPKTLLALVLGADTKIPTKNSKNSTQKTAIRGRTNR